MKTVRFYMLILLAFITPLTLLAKNKWNTPDKGCFKYQKDVDNTVSDYSTSMSTVYFHGKLFNFINYQVTGGDYGKIVVRKLSLSTDKTSWSMSKQDDEVNLKDLANNDWQPTPVLFHDSLYLFVHNPYISYSKYNEKNDSWTVLKEIPKIFPSYQAAAQLQYGAAVVVDDKLCLFCGPFNNPSINIIWTKDMVNWNCTYTGVSSGLKYTQTHTTVTGGPAQVYTGFEALSNQTFSWIEYAHYHISVATKSLLDSNGKINTKIILAYLTDGGSSAKVAEMVFDEKDNLKLVSDVIVASEFEYSFVTIADGKVKGDPATGNCTQLFLKKAEKDNLYCRYRMLRYQKMEGGTWTKQENNLVPQNYLWADKNLELNAVNFLTGDGKQLMCLVYRGYDDWDHPLNIAWAENSQVNAAGTQSVLQTPPVVDTNLKIIGKEESYARISTAGNFPLVQNYPNPFSGFTTIKYSVGTNNVESSYGLQQYTSLAVYDSRGKLVKTLVNEIKPPGTYEVQWDASEVPAGIYLCKLLNGKKSGVCKLVVNN